MKDKTKYIAGYINVPKDWLIPMWELERTSMQQLIDRRKAESEKGVIVACMPEPLKQP